MHRIYFDVNEGDERGRFDLGIPAALRDIDAVGSELRDGMPVVLYDNEEVEVEAVIEFDHRARSNLYEHLAQISYTRAA